MAENLTEPVPLVPPTDRPAMADPLLVQELVAAKRAGVVRLSWLAAWVVGAVVLHLALDSPFTDATLLVYALPLLFLVGFTINGVARLCGVWRHRRRLGTGAWRWIPPERLRWRGRTVAFDLAEGEQGQVRLYSNGLAELSRRHGVWVISGERGGVWLRSAGSTVRQRVYVGEREFPGEPGEPDSPPAGWKSYIVLTFIVILVELGLLWLALGDPVQAFREQPAPVIVVALAVASILASIPTTLEASRWREPEQWHEVPVSVTGTGFRRPWSNQYSVRGIGTLPDGTTVPVHVLYAHMDMVAIFSATGKLWVADPPAPSSKSVTGLPHGLPVRSRVWFGAP